MNESDFTMTLIILEIIFSIMILKTLSNAGAKKASLVLIAFIMAAWLTSVYIMLSNGFFSSTEVPQIAFATVLSIPIIMTLVVQKFWEPARNIISNISTKSFLKLQQMRSTFGILFFCTSALPIWFQYIGGIGDILAGVGAFLALRFMSKHPEQERKAIFKGNFIGLLDFAIVLNLGLFVVLKDHSPDIMFDLVPLYVVPMFILLHIFSLQKLSSGKS